MLLSAAMMAPYNIAVASSPGNKSRRPIPEDFDDPILKAIAFGMGAPNPHNTQAWKFKLISKTEMLLFVDVGRLLLSTDPTTRQIHIGCGCFLGVLQVGMTTLGYKTDIEMWPQGIYDSSETGSKPVARVSLRKDNVAKDILAEAIYLRKTNRLEYNDHTLPEALFKTIMEVTNPAYCSINYISNSSLPKHLDILYQGMEVECRTYKTYEESRKWFRENDDLIREKRDGINLPGGGTTGVTKYFAERSLKGLKPEDWHKTANINFYLSRYKKKVTQSKGIVQFVTETNTPQAWLKAGMDYARFQLAVTRQQYFIHPMSQVLQEFDEMKSLREQYDQLNNLKGEQKIQMVVRIGKAKEPFMSYRRNVEDLLR